MQAVLIAGADTISGVGWRQPLAEVVVGGITLLQRAARAARRAGATRLLILSAGERQRAQIEGDPQLEGVSVVWRAHDHLIASASAALGAASEDLDERFWLTSVDRVISPQLFPPAALEGAAEALDLEGREVGVYLMTRAAVLDATAAGGDLQALAARLRPLDAHRPPQPVWHIVRAPEDIDGAMDVLMHSLRKPLGRNADGVTAYLINRPLSLLMSRRLVSTFVTPNQITTVGLIMGLVAAWIVPEASWMSLALGGVLLQLSSILDGVDGELARLRLTTSVNGEWFDTICDDLINLSFLFGLGFACSARFDASWPMVLGSVTLGIGVLLVSSMYRDLIRAGIASHNNFDWDFEGDGRGGPLRWVVIGFSYFAKRDSYTLAVALLLCLNSPLPAFLILVIGTNLIALGLVIQKARAAFGRDRAAAPTGELSGASAQTHQTSL